MDAAGVQVEVIRQGIGTKGLGTEGPLSTSACLMGRGIPVYWISRSSFFVVTPRVLVQLGEAVGTEIRGQFFDGLGQQFRTEFEEVGVLRIGINDSLP